MTRKPYVAEDLLRMRWVGTPRMSPCGRFVAFVVTEVLDKENAYASSIWLYDSAVRDYDPLSIRQITYRGGKVKGRDYNPRWSPDGTMIAFLSDRAGSNQIFVMDMTGGEARRITDMPKGVSDFDWLGSDALVFSAKEAEDRPKLREGATARRITTLRYKFNGAGYLDGLHTQLWRVGLEGPSENAGLHAEQNSETKGARSSGQYAGQSPGQHPGPRSDQSSCEGADQYPGQGSGQSPCEGAGQYPGHGSCQSPGQNLRRLTDGPYDCSSPVVSPSGKYIAFISKRTEDEMALYSDLYLLDSQTGELKKLTASRGHVRGAVFAPDESAVYYIGHEKGQSYPGGYSEIWKVDLSTLERKVISAGFPYLIGGGIGGDVGPDQGNMGLKASSCGGFLYFTAVDGGSSYLYRLAVDGGAWEKVYGEGQMVVKSYDVAGGKVVLNKATPVTMGDLWYGNLPDRTPITGSQDASTGAGVGISGSSGTISSAEPQDVSVDGLKFRSGDPDEHPLKMVTGFNSQLASERYAGWPRPVTFNHPDGTRLEGWVILPNGFEKGKKYPLIMEIHGGPHTTYGNVFFHEFQMLAGHGFGVLYTNPRGSMGYGEEFARAVVGDWCGVDAEDLEFMAREALRMFDWVDPKRFGVTGGSQGGYFTNWLIGHTDLFAAAVTQRSMSNLYSKYGVSDIGWSGDRAGMGGKDLWDHEDFIMERSPIRYAPNVKTPTLVIHSDQDFRCPLEQGEQWYVALKRLGVTTEMLLFHGENHEISRSGKPANRIVRLEAILEWFERFMK
ncbi:MAG: S9 family peptidase [Bacillota bacterium]